MMKAQEMFERLGFKRSEDKIAIMYEFKENNFSTKKVSFFKNNKEYMCEETLGIMEYGFPMAIDKELNEAIQVQLKELREK